MNRPHPRRLRTASARFGRLSGIARNMEGPSMNPQPNSPEIRNDLVSRVRLEIAAGTYDTPEKMEAALDRLAARLCFD
ncbi:MAG TPA: flagellar biosynthesis anti-sigma factor FlgM [Gemmataceae bacterium]|jgi:hypothetical protein|nr:flagellar biosynthesis anti-sigma factor FlgM [Gemmataceae bacterium]